MIKINVLLSVRPPMLATALGQAIGQQADMEVIGEVPSALALLSIAKQMQVDAVILAPFKEDREPLICRYLLVRYPQMKIITLSGKGTTAFLSTADGAREAIESSKESLLHALRGAGQYALKGTGQYERGMFLPFTSPATHNSTFRKRRLVAQAL